MNEEKDLIKPIQKFISENWDDKNETFSQFLDRMVDKNMMNCIGDEE
jgi:hypothetical protein